METGLVLRVPELEPLVRRVRRRCAPANADVPAHVTALYPFRPWESLDEAALAGLAALLAAAAPIDVVFADTGRFPGVGWLAPEPRAPFDALTEALVRAYPDCRPYGGQFADPVPHLTICKGAEAAVARAERAIRAGMPAPVRARLETCSLFVLTDEGWRETRRFPLG